ALLGALGCSLLFGSIELVRCPQLVAFVSIRNQDREQGGARLSAQANSQRASAKLLNACYIAPRSVAARHASSELRATKTDATLLAKRPAQLGNRQASKQLALAKQDVAVASKTPSYKPAPRSPRPVLLNTEMPR